MRKALLTLAVAAIAAMSLSPVQAGNEIAGTILDKNVMTPAVSAPHDPWHEGGLEFSFVTGPFMGPSFGINGARERFNYWGNSFRLGYNLTDVIGSSFYRGNVQVVGELFAAEIFNTVGGGSYVVGPNVLFRYNFIQEGWPVVPYLQLGPGIAMTDTDNNAIGQDFCFQLNIGAGLRYMINDKWAIITEGGWHHLSNAGLAEHNLGSNEAYGQLGVSYFFK